MKPSVHSPEQRANLRIAYLVGSFPYVTETFVVNQVVGMAARGHQVDVYTTAPETVHHVSEGVRRYRLMERTHYLFGSPNRPIRAVKAALWLLRDGWRLPRVLLRSLNVARYGRAAASLGLLCAALTLHRRNAGRYDIVHCQFGTLGELALRLREIGALSGKLVVSFRGFDATKYLRAHPRAYDELFRCADLVLPVSEALAHRLVEAGCDRSKIVVHHSGIECAKFPYIERGRSVREPMQLISVARLTEKKGIEYAIRAVAQLVAAGRAVSYRIVGEGQLRLQLESLVAKLGVGTQVQLLGWRSHDEVVTLLERAHVLVAPSVSAADGDEEGIPNAVKEAMAMGMPAVSTRHGGIPELIEDGVSGFLVPERDAETLAQRLLYLADHPEQWGPLGRAAREHIKSQFDIHRLNDELAHLYQGLLMRNVGSSESASRPRTAEAV